MKTHKKLMVCIEAFLTLLILWLILTSGVKEFQDNSNKRLTEIAVFGIEVCGTCSLSKDAVEELRQRYPYYKYVYYTIDKDIEVTNRYSIKFKPTILLLNKEGYELGRIEKSSDFNEYHDMILKIKKSHPTPIKSYNKPTKLGSSIVSIYLFEKSSNKYIEIKHELKNKTQVKYPKIIALEYLFSIQNDIPVGLSNDIPKGTKLNKITEIFGVTVVTLSKDFTKIFNTEKEQNAINQIAITLLSNKDVSKVQIVSENYRSKIITKESLRTIVIQKKK